MPIEAIEVITYILSTVVIGLITVLLTRLSKPQQERELTLTQIVEGLAKTVDLTSDQLIERIKQIGEMDEQINSLRREVTRLSDEIRRKNRELREERAHNALLMQQLIEQAKLVPIKRPVLTDTDPPRKKEV